MGERKVLNKYLPPDFDPEQLARGVRQIKKREREKKIASNHQIKVRRELRRPPARRLRPAAALTRRVAALPPDARRCA